MFRVGPATPRRLSAVDWEQIRGEYDRRRHAAFPDSQGFHSRNFGQHWLSRFDGRGFTIEPDGESWRWGLELAGVSGKARILADADRCFH